MKRKHRATRSGALLAFLLTTMHADAQRWIQLAKPATGPTPDLYGVHFFNRDSGYVCGEAGGSGRLYFTADGGTSWRELTSRLPGSPGALNDLQFLPDGTGVIVGDNAYVALTADRGATWRAADVTHGAWPGGGDIQGVHLLDGSTIYVVGKAAGSGNGPRIARSFDGGITWIGIPQTGPANNLYAIDFFDALHGVVVGTGANARKSTTADGGLTWEANGHIGSDPTRSLSFYGVDAVAGTPIAYASGGNVVGSGRFAEVRKTTDHGLTWSATALGPSLPGNNKTANAVLALTDEIVYVSTQGFRIYRSIDGGASWSIESLPSGSSDLRRICATPTDELYVVGRSGSVLRAALLPHPVLLSPSLSFASICGGDSVTVRDTIVNAGLARLRIEGATVEATSAPGVKLIIDALPTVIGPLGAGELVLRAEIGREVPPGRHTGVISIRTNDSLHGGRDTLLMIPIAVDVMPRELAIAHDIVADAGYVPIGRSSMLRLAGALLNHGNCPVRITRLRLALGSDFHLADTTGMTLPAGGGADLDVIFEPSAPCLRIDTLLIDHDGSSVPSPMRITLAGTGLERTLAAEPGDTLRLRSTPVGAPVRDTLRLINRKVGGCLDTTLLLRLAIVGPDAADFALEAGGATGGGLPIPPHDELRIPIVAIPSAAGERRAMVVIDHDAGGASPDTVWLAVRGLRPELTGSVESVRFGVTEVGVGRDSLVEDMLVNLGDAGAVIESVVVEGPDAADFTVAGPSTPLELPMGGSASLTLGFTPGAVGERHALLRVRPRNADDITVELGGRGALRWFSVGRDSIGCSPTRVGSCGDTVLDAFIRNDGELPVTLHRLTIVPSPDGSGDAAAAFSILEPGLPPDLPVAPGDSVRVVLHFCPIADRSHEALLTIDGDGAGTPLRVKLAGEGFSGPSLAIDTIAFPPTPIMMARDTIVERCILNGSPSAMRVDSIVVSGADFTLDGAPVSPTIPARGAGGVSLRFAPSAGGPSTGYLLVYHDGELAPLGRVGLVGSGLAIALAYDPPLGPGGLDFGPVRVGRSVEKTVTVTNVSSAPLTLDEVGATTPAFTIVSPPGLPVPLGPGEPLKLRIRFMPGIVGDHGAMIWIRSGRFIDSALRVGGRGVIRGLHLASDTIDLGIRRGGEVVDTGVVLINEPADPSLLPEDLDAVSVDGATFIPSAGLSVTGTLPGLIPPNTRATIRLRHVVPSAPGSHAALLLIEYDRHEVDGATVSDTLRPVLLWRVEDARDTTFRVGAFLGAGLAGGAGDTIRLPVILAPGAAAAGVDAIVLRLGFRPTMLRPLDVVGLGDVAVLPAEQESPGTLLLRLATGGGFVADTIAVVAFRVLLGDSLVTTIRIDSIAAVARPDVIFTGDSARFAIVGLCDPAGELIRFGPMPSLASKPNPAAERLTIEYTLPAICDHRLGLFDATGSELIHLAGGVERPGSHAIPLDVTALPAGTYYCVLSAERFSRTIIVRIIK